MTTDAPADDPGSPATAPRPPLVERALAQRVQGVPPSGIRRFFDIAATMDDVISLGVGEPDFDTPRAIVEAGVESLREGRTHYTSNYGTLELRRALADHLERRYGVRYDPTTELLITVGASEAVDLALRATCDPGDEVILHEPSYVAYVPAIVFAGGTVRHVATRFEDDFALDPAAVEAAITPRTKALFLGYPCNPTGAVLPVEIQDELAAIAVRHDLLVYSDEIYDRLAYGDYTPSGDERAAGHARADDPDGRLLEGVRDDRLAGRLPRGTGGDARGDRQDPPVRDHVGARRSPRTRRWSRSSRASPRSSGCGPSTTAAAGSSSTGSTPSASRRSSRSVRSMHSRGSPRPGCRTRRSPQGLLTEEHVAAIPGSAFGPSGAGHVRMCYATSYERLEEALRRIGRYVESVRA